MKFEIEIVGDNPFSAGWVAYILGFPKDAPPTLAEGLPRESWEDGWAMAEETTTLAAVRYVFEKQLDLERPQYRCAYLHDFSEEVVRMFARPKSQALKNLGEE